MRVALCRSASTDQSACPTCCPAAGRADSEGVTIDKIRAVSVCVRASQCVYGLCPCRGLSCAARWPLRTVAHVAGSDRVPLDVQYYDPMPRRMCIRTTHASAGYLNVLVVVHQTRPSRLRLRSSLIVRLRSGSPSPSRRNAPTATRTEFGL